MMTVAPLISSHPLLISPFFPAFRTTFPSPFYFILFCRDLCSPFPSFVFHVPTTTTTTTTTLTQNKKMVIIIIKTERQDNDSKALQIYQCKRRGYSWSLIDDHLSLLSFFFPFLLLCFTRLSLLCNCMRSNWWWRKNSSKCKFRQLSVSSLIRDHHSRLLTLLRLKAWSFMSWLLMYLKLSHV